MENKENNCEKLPSGSWVFIAIVLMMYSIGGFVSGFAACLVWMGR